MARDRDTKRHMPLMSGNMDRNSSNIDPHSIGMKGVGLLEDPPGTCIAYTTVNSQKAESPLLLDRLINTLQRTRQFTAKALLSDYSLEKDALGRPLLCSGQARGPSISFSRVPGSTWAAMSEVKGLGIDAALPEEFDAPYPAHRVFGRDELDRALRLCGGGLREASALLWSAKEAAVKALGCGFHFFGPLEVKVEKIRPARRGFLFLLDAGICVPVRTQRHGRLWVSIAWIES